MDNPPNSDNANMDSPTEATAGSTQLISASHSRVNVHCNACESYLGIFENEWIRLTSSYARPVQQGIHHGTDISTKTRIVPPATTHRCAEGCTLSDVVCQKCSTTVGQYCREAPTVEQHYLEGVYFYKMSKVTLKDSVLEQTDPIFAYREEPTPEAMGSPVPSVVAPDPKWSHPSPVKSHTTNTYHMDGMPPPPSRSSRTPAKAHTSEAHRSSARPQSHPAHVSRASSSVRAGSTLSQVQPWPVQITNPTDTPEGLLALRAVLQQSVEFEKMARTVDSIQREMRELRQSTTPFQGTAIMNTRTQEEDEELQALRAENHALKKVLKSLPAQTQFENPQYSRIRDEGFRTPASQSSKALGKRKRGSLAADDSLFYEDGTAGGYDDFDEQMNGTSGLAILERDTEQGYSIWQGEEEGSEGGDYSEGNEDRNEDNDPAQSAALDYAPSDTAVGERHSARSRESRQILPEDFIREEQLYLHSDSNDENFDPNDPKVKGRKHKRTRSAERRRRKRVDRQQESLWKKGVPGGGYENGDGWVEQKRHHSGRFGRKAEIGDGLAVYPKYINDKLFANGRQIPTTHKRLARELVYIGMEDWIDKDKSDALYRRTIRVARKHYAYHHGGISSKALCQGKYTRKDLQQVGMWDDDLFEEINLGEESDVDRLDFPLDPKLKISMDKWKKEGLLAKGRREKAARGAAMTSSAGEIENIDALPILEDLAADSAYTAPRNHTLDLTKITDFSDEDDLDQQSGQLTMPEVPDRMAKHKKFDSIWQVPAPISDNSVLSSYQQAESRIKAAEEDMGEPTFRSKKAQAFKTIGPQPVAFSAVFSGVPSDTYTTPANSRSKTGTRKKGHSSDTIQTAAQRGLGVKVTVEPTAGRGTTNQVAATRSVQNSHWRTHTVAHHLSLLDLSTKQEQSFLKELRAYSAVDKDTGANLSPEQHVAFTDEALMNHAENFLETNVVRVGGSRKIGFEFWPEDGPTDLSYVSGKERIRQHVYDILLVQRHNKARNLRNHFSKSLGQHLEITQILDKVSTRPGRSAGNATSPALPLSSQKRAFEDGPRYEAKPGFAGNRYYHADGVPRTPEDAARLERKLMKKSGTRKSLPTSLSDEMVKSQDRIRRRATMLGTSTTNAVDPSLMTPSAREASVLPDSILHMASTLSQITKTFEGIIETADRDSDASDNRRDEIVSTDQLEPSTRSDLTNPVDSAEIQEFQLTGTTLDNDGADVGIPIVAGSHGEVVAITTRSARKSLQRRSEIGKATTPALLTRSAVKTTASAKSQPRLTKMTARKSVGEIPSRNSPASMSDKENVLPESETGASSAAEDTEPPAKRVKRY